MQKDTTKKFFHQALNIKWYRGLLKGKYTLRRSINTAVDGVLTVEILALMISGMMISESLMPFLNFGSVSVGRTIHTLASHWYLLTMAIHVGLHLEIDTWLAVFLDFGAIVWLVAILSRFGYALSHQKTKQH